VSGARTDRLPEKYRLARNLTKGMEVRDNDGAWWPIDSILRVLAPINIVRVTFSDGEVANYAPKDRVMSR
jgi:hypothetical protein